MSQPTILPDGRPIHWSAIKLALIHFWPLEGSTTSWKHNTETLSFHFKLMYSKRFSSQLIYALDKH